MFMHPIEKISVMNGRSEHNNLSNDHTEKRSNIRDARFLQNVEKMSAAVLTGRVLDFWLPN